MLSIFKYSVEKNNPDYKAKEKLIAGMESVPEVILILLV
jgi:hypothetical protein